MAIFVVAGYSVLCSFLILVCLDVMFPLRVRFDEELEGVDAVYHGGAARQTPPLHRTPSMRNTPPSNAPHGLSLLRGASSVRNTPPLQTLSEMCDPSSHSQASFRPHSGEGPDS